MSISIPIGIEFGVHLLARLFIDGFTGDFGNEKFMKNARRTASSVANVAYK